MDGGAAGGAGVLHPRRRHKAEGVIRLESKGAGKLLARKSGIAVADEDLVDVLSFQARIGKRATRRLNDQRFDIFIFMLSEPGVAPADNAGGHAFSPGEFLPLLNQTRAGWTSGA